jgi:serine/threonine-protein kinase
MGALKGKLQYMSPEQAWGKSVDGRSDIFSLGAVLYEMLTGAKLFAAESEIGVLDAVRECRVRSVRELVSSIPPEVDRIVSKALAKDSEDRYAIAGQLAQDIDAFLETLRPVPSESELATFLKELFDGTARPARIAEPAGPAAAAPASRVPAPSPAPAPAAAPTPAYAAPAAFAPARPAAVSTFPLSAPSAAATAATDTAFEVAGRPKKGGGLRIAIAAAALLVLALAAFFLFGRKTPPAGAPVQAAPAEAPAPGAPVPAPGADGAPLAAGETPPPEGAVPANVEALVEQALAERAAKLREDLEAEKKRLEAELAAAQKEDGGGGGG